MISISSQLLLFVDSKIKSTVKGIHSALYLVEAVPGVEHGDKGLAGPTP